MWAPVTRHFRRESSETKLARLVDFALPTRPGLRVAGLRQLRGLILVAFMAASSMGRLQLDEEEPGAEEPELAMLEAVLLLMLSMVVLIGTMDRGFCIREKLFCRRVFLNTERSAPPKKDSKSDVFMSVK